MRRLYRQIFGRTGERGNLREFEGICRNCAHTKLLTRFFRQNSCQKNYENFFIFHLNLYGNAVQYNQTMQEPLGLLQILAEDNVRDYEAIAEGLRDYEELQTGRRIIAARAEAQGLTVGEYLGRRAALARLHRRAESLGLAYWPALRQRGVDPRAFVAAERVLSSQVGSLWGEILPDGTRSHGGWDSWGHYGVSPREVADAWFAAGCRDTGKFRLQIAAGIVARKGDTLPWLRAYVRGCRWLWGNRLMGLPWSRQAMAALGKISPELRRAAIGKFFADGGRPAETIRIRHLDWAEVARVQAILRGGSVRARAAMAGMRRACELLGCQDDDLAAALAPAYPALPLPLARRLALGASPAQLADGQLTKKEAHRWASAGAPDVKTWLAEELDLPAHRSVRVLRWLEHCKKTGRWAAVERERTAHVPGEPHPRQYSLLDILDEIQDEDVLTGRDSVDAVLQRAAQRLGDAWMTAQMADHRILADLPKWAERLPRGVRILRTPAQLATEGREMHHCVGGYQSAVERGQCHILAVRTRQGRSTVGPEFVHGAGAFEAVAVVHPAAALRLAPDFFVGVFQNANRAPVGQPPQFEAVALHVFNLMD